MLLSRTYINIYKGAVEYLILNFLSAIQPTKINI